MKRKHPLWRSLSSCVSPPLLSGWAGEPAGERSYVIYNYGRGRPVLWERGRFPTRGSAGAALTKNSARALRVRGNNTKCRRVGAARCTCPKYIRAAEPSIRNYQSLAKQNYYPVLTMAGPENYIVRSSSCIKTKSGLAIAQLPGL